MRILFTSDLHGLPEAYRGFSETLKMLDIGIIAGDLLDEFIPDEQLMKMLNLSRDDFLEELSDPDPPIGDRLEAWRDSPQHSHLMRGLEAKEQEIKHVLQKAGKPIVVVRGNTTGPPLPMKDSSTTFTGSGSTSVVFRSSATAGSAAISTRNGRWTGSPSSNH